MRHVQSYYISKGQNLKLGTVFLEDPDKYGPLA